MLWTMIVWKKSMVNAGVICLIDLLTDKNLKVDQKYESQELHTEKLTLTRVLK